MNIENQYFGSDEFQVWFKKNDDIERHRVFVYKDLKEALFIAYQAGMRQQLAKPAPEAQILIDALRGSLQVLTAGFKTPSSRNSECHRIISDALAAYDTKATPDNGVNHDGQ